MSPELVAILAAIAAEQARMMSMQAANQARLMRGESLAYPESEFGYIAAELDRLSVAARNAS